MLKINIDYFQSRYHFTNNFAKNQIHLDCFESSKKGIQSQRSHKSKNTNYAFDESISMKNQSLQYITDILMSSLNFVIQRA